MKNMREQTKIIPIKKIRELLAEGKNVEILGPDGFQPVTEFVDKGMWVGYRCTNLNDGREVIVNENHLFETPSGWELTKTLVGRCKILMNSGSFEDCIIEKTTQKHKIVDIQVDHPKHRYYANGFSSHNTNVGKSLFMCHMAAANVSMGQNVLYITCEMAEERIAERIDANLLNMKINDMRELPPIMYKKRFESIKDKIKGRLFIKQYPTGTGNVNHFHHLIDELKLKKNFIPDIIYVDYINICSSVRYTGGAHNSYTIVKAIAEELRGLAVQHDVPVVSATQVNRSGFNDSDFGLESTSESFGLPATADMMVGLIATEQLDAQGQIMVKQLKNRYDEITGKNARFLLGIDKPKMKLFDLPDSEQAGLHEHRTSQKAPASLQDTLRDVNDVEPPVRRPKKKFGDFVH